MEDMSVSNSMRKDFSPPRFPPYKSTDEGKKITQVFYKTQANSPARSAGKKSRDPTPDHSPEAGGFKIFHSPPESAGKRSRVHTPDHSLDEEFSTSSRSAPGSAEKKSRQESLESPDSSYTKIVAQEETPGAKTAGLLSALNMRSPIRDFPRMKMSDSSNARSAEIQDPQEFPHPIFSYFTRSNIGPMKEAETLGEKTAGLSSSSFYEELPNDSMMDMPESSNARSATSNPFPSLPHLPPEVTREIQDALSKLTSSEALTEEDATALLDKLGTLMIRHRQKNTAATPMNLFNPSVLVQMCNLTNSQHGTTHATTGARVAHKYLNSAITTALVYMTTEQKENLFHLLGTDAIANNPCYAPISTHCFQKYFVEIDPKRGKELKQLPSQEKTLQKIIEKAQRDIDKESTTPSAHSKATITLCQKVQELARRLPFDYFFHTSSESNIPYFFTSGIPVSHGKDYPGAFTSSNFEESFGRVAVAVPSNRLAAMHPNLTRIERRAIEDGSPIWIGSNEPLKIDPHIVVYSSDLSTTDLSDLKRKLGSDKLFIPSDVLAKFLSYSREDHWYTPSISGMKKCDIETYSISETPK